MKDYRRAVSHSLTQLETIVRGMEYFGSRSGRPVDECLREVQSCLIYIGVFGMRYGTIPEGYDLSMTHLEYDEAQRRELPSLIYLIDENLQPILPRNVETGPGAERLQQLKSDLRKRHVVSYFTTPEDLGGKVLHDLHKVLEKQGTEIEGSLENEGLPDFCDIYNKFRHLPKLVRGQEMIAQFSIRHVHAVDANDCSALDLEPGATVRAFGSLGGSDRNRVDIYATNELAETLMSVLEGQLVRARGICIFGTSNEVEWTSEEPIVQVRDYSGLHVQEVIAILGDSGVTA